MNVRIDKCRLPLRQWDCFHVNLKNRPPTVFRRSRAVDGGVEYKKIVNVPSVGPIDWILFYIRLRSFSEIAFCTFLRILFLCNLLHVKPFTCTVNRPNRNRQFEGHLLWGLTVVKEIHDFEIMRPSPVNHFAFSAHGTHMASVRNTGDPSSRTDL